MSIILQCPICQQPLQFHTNCWQCSNRHSFDQARQGYVNLHTVQHKHSKNPGDTAQSIAARQRFLSQDFYLPLQHKITEILQYYQIESLLDIGCGEGYYTRAMATVVPNVMGLDIAKAAIQTAAKQDNQHQNNRYQSNQHKVQWVVGTGAILPLSNQSVKMCSSLFSPLPKAEMLRVLHEDGFLLVATPAAHHLYSMRAALFQQVQAHTPEKFLQQLAPEFRLEQAWLISNDLYLSQENLTDLIAMTPYAYKAKVENRAKLENQDGFKTKAAFWVYLLRKNIF